MKKLWTLALALLMLASMCAAALADGETLTMWTFPFSTDENAAEERAMYDEMTAEFEAQTGVKVNVEIIPWANRETKMLTAIAAKSGPDIMYLNSDILKLFKAYGILAPITDYVSQETIDGYAAQMLDGSVRFDGVIYGLPCLIDLGAPVYNLDLLAEIGMTEETLPKTWDEYDAMLAALKEKGITGVYCNYAGGLVSGYAYPMFFSEGCDVIKEDGTVDIDSEAGRKVLNRLVSWYQNGYTPTDSMSVSDDDANFISGKVASCLSPKGAGFFTRVAPTLTFNWAAGPILAGDAGQYGISTVAALGVSNNCKNVEMAAKWIEFFVDNDRNARFTSFGGYISPKNGATTAYTAKGYEQVLSNLQCVKGEANHAAARTLGTVYVPDIQAMLSGSVDFETGVAKMKTDMEALVANIEALSNN